ncbi:unnamed protein product [Cyprideis torosa]|uniref:Palmitoyltransferase n=1 Tax=Cyprideis torosa TaxID=163714 RepID=A0A7R8WH33_9CRUS|nr:unnamed protein product [Cyprideis torosa]CAG0897324.1 unnamed protein product [Cyprideis torosa]
MPAVEHNACRRCIRPLEFTLAFVILLMIGWAYYLYVFEFCVRIYGFKTIFLTCLCVLSLTGFHIILILYLLTFFGALCIGNNLIPEQYHLDDSVFEELKRLQSVDERENILSRLIVERELRILERDLDGNIRVCYHCRWLKPDRTHHCSACGVCSLKLDHHCGFLGVCVGFYNYKYFVLFMPYTLLFVVYSVLTSLPYWFLRPPFQKPVDPYNTVIFAQIICAYYIGLTFGVLVTAFGFAHVLLINRNKTTLEDMRDPRFIWGRSNNAYNLGCIQNWKQVFGQHPLIWFLPIPAGMGNGYEFPLNDFDKMSKSPSKSVLASETCPCAGLKKTEEAPLSTQRNGRKFGGEKDSATATTTLSLLREMRKRRSFLPLSPRAPSFDFKLNESSEISDVPFDFKDV